MKHYFSPAIKELKDRVLKAVDKMMNELNNGTS
jgi:hypothetical protein